MTSHELMNDLQKAHATVAAWPQSMRDQIVVHSTPWRANSVFSSASKLTVRPRSEAPEEIIRASGASLCVGCGDAFYDHPRIAFSDDYPNDSFPIILTKLCDGRLRKL